MSVRANVMISGNLRVMFFRKAIRNHALLHRLSGYVRNTENGAVEAVFEGNREDIEDVVSVLKNGFQGAAIEDVAVTWAESTGLEGFEVR